MATTEGSILEVELAVTKDTEPSPGQNAQLFGQHFAIIVDVKAAVCHRAVAAHFETRYEKSEKAVNIVTCRVEECTGQSLGVCV